MSSNGQQPGSATGNLPTGHIFAVLGLIIAIIALPIGVAQSIWLAGLAAIFLGTAVFALLKIHSINHTVHIKTALSEPRYRTLYDTVLTANLPYLQRFFQTAEPDPKAGFLQLLRSTFTFGLLLRSLLFAVIYPVALLLLHWGLSGGSGRLGEIVLIPAADPAWKGYATIGLMALFVSIVSLSKWASASPERFVRSVPGWLTLVGLALLLSILLLLNLPIAAAAFAGALAIAIALAATLATALAAAIAITFATAAALAYATAFTLATAAAAAFATAFATAFAATIAIAFALATLKLKKNDRGKAAAILAVAAPAAAICASVFWLPWETLGDKAGRTTSIFMFLGVLPLINALFDAISYGVTLVLTQRGLHGWPVLYAVLDALLALTLFLGLGATLVYVVAIIESITGIGWVDLNGLLRNAGNVQQYWWLYAMLFSTALPTFYHLGLAAVSLQCFVPLRWRRGLAAAIDAAHTGSVPGGVAAVLGLAALWSATWAAAVLALLGLAWVSLKFGVGHLLLLYRDILEQLAIRLGGI
ncbi:hypothetical protein [Leisingera aquaemixtae]|uniref:Uncharacterized protein n=1 Tax=Leisingera aquaemixtae TaxID=1396826 RepID=A0A0P1HLJ7_9RHOB|nr:hypothetical protein [Leisingera aquaemixtae]CUH99813.1 hypothetical protein PHA8399_01939 [Leisingera aquaemixtae]